jgi:hypothetical protein
VEFLQKQVSCIISDFPRYVAYDAVDIGTNQSWGHSKYDEPDGAS